MESFHTDIFYLILIEILQILMDRLKSIINQQHPLRPSQSGQICTNYKLQYSK